MIRGIAALHNEHVFVVLVGVRRRSCSFTAGPKRHLAPIYSVEDVTLNAGSCMAGRRNSVCRMFHEFGGNCPWLLDIVALSQTSALLS